MRKLKLAAVIATAIVWSVPVLAMVADLGWWILTNNTVTGLKWDLRRVDALTLWLALGLVVAWPLSKLLVKD